MKISFLRVGVLSVVGTVVIGALLACCFLRSRTAGVDTSTERKPLRFYRSGTEWFADVPQHTKAENQMVAGADTLMILSGTGEVITPDDGIASVGSGGNYALAAARALKENTELSAREIAEKALHIAADICVFTNHNVIVEEV